MNRSLTTKEKNAIDDMLAFIQKIINCDEKLGEPCNPERSTIKMRPERVSEIRDIVKGLRGLLDENKIDVGSRKDSDKASTDSGGIHLNENFGGDWTNWITFPDDWKLSDCSEGYFQSFWRLVEVLFHEYYHYVHHTGFLGTLNKAWQLVSFLPFAPVIKVTGLGPDTWAGFEYTTYYDTYFVLDAIYDMLSDICLCTEDCIDCCDQNLQYLKEARKNQLAGTN
jgi:hypothetical protein